MLTLQLKRTARYLNDALISGIIPKNGEPFLVENSVNSSDVFVSIDCITASSMTRKDVFLKEKDWSLFELQSGLVPEVGQTVFVKFTNANSAASPSISISIDTVLTDPRNIAFKDGDSYSINISTSRFNWGAGDTRVFTFDGTYWIVQLPDEYLSSSLLFIGNGIDTISTLYQNGTYIPVSKYISGDMIRNGSIAISKLDPDIDFASKESLQAISDALDSFQSETNGSIESINSSISLNKIYSVFCSSSSNSAIKVIDVPSDVPIYDDILKYDGFTFIVRFEYANTAVYPKFEVYSLIQRAAPIIPLCSIYIGNEPLTSAFYWKDNDSIMFTYNAQDNRWYMDSTNAMSIMASWCSENNTTLINGGMIATGSITADKIQAGSITADQIAVGSLPASVLDQQFSAALNNLNFIEQQAASSKQVVCTCNTDGDEIIKEVYLNGDAALSISMLGEAPMYGTTLVIKFTHQNTSVNGCSLRLILDGFPFPAAANLVPVIGYYDDNNLFHGLEPDQELNWLDNDTRVLVYDGAHWIIQPSTGYLRRAAEWCLSNNQTFIQGGSIIAGRISCAQLEAGTIDTGKISLSYYSLDSDGNLINYGGFYHYDGSTTAETTKGVMMYGSDKDHYNFVVTNKGIAVNAGNAYIRGYGDGLRLHSNGEFYLNTDDSANSGNIVIGRSANTTYFRSGSVNITGSMTLLNSILNVKNLPKASDAGFDLNNLAVGDFWIDTSSSNTLKVKL